MDAHSERELADFARRLHSDVLEKSFGDEDDAVFAEDAFAEITTDMLAEAGVIEDATVCYFERRSTSGNAKVNAFNVHVDEGCLDLFVCSYAGLESIEQAHKPDLQSALHQACRFFALCIQGGHLKTEESSDQYAMMSRIWEVGDRLDRVRVFLLTDRAAAVKTAQTLRLDPFKGYALSFQVWDVQRFHRLMQSDEPREAIEIDFEQEFGGAIPCLKLPDADGDYQGYLTVLPGEVLYRLYDDYGSRLLELNVRSFLQARGRVNSGIRRTLKTEPGHFFAYNNGISATADDVRLCRLDDGQLAIASVRGFQIVNGGQTTASIHRARREDRQDLAAVQVQAKLTVVQPALLDVLVPSISRYANSQNKVNDADFSANDAYHVELQKLSETTWLPGAQSRWFYERARGQYQVAKQRESVTADRKRQFELKTPAKQVFTKTDLAKFVNSWDQLPHVVSRGNQKNFSSFMVRVSEEKGKDWLPDAAYFKSVVAMGILFKAVERAVRDAKFPAYRANITTYTMAYLSYWTGRSLNLGTVWESQHVPEVFVTAIHEWIGPINDAIIDSAGTRNVTEWCKQEACWKRIRVLQLDLPATLLEMRSARDEAGEEVVELLTEADVRNISECMQISADDWLLIHAWAKGPGGLKSFQWGIAHTLSGYAACEWDRRPSAKQAKWAVQMIEDARELGIIGRNGGRQDEDAEEPIL